MIKFHVYDRALHRTDFIEMNRSYLNWFRDECLRYFELDMVDTIGPIDEYVENSMKLFESFAPPESIVYMISIDTKIAGMAGLKKINKEFAEIKRMYVKPEFRGNGLGYATMNKLIETAKEFGYSKLRLDTGPFNTTAHRIYISSGFYEIEEYAEAEVPSIIRHDWFFMEKIL
ncbi:MAG: GNAT family N-acetyltransferase [Promethearchaeota archaeon]